VTSGSRAHQTPRLQQQHPSSWFRRTRCARDRADEICIAVALDSWKPTRGTRLTGERNHGRRFILSNNKLVRADPPPGHVRDANFDAEIPLGFGEQLAVVSAREDCRPATLAQLCGDETASMAVGTKHGHAFIRRQQIRLHAKRPPSTAPAAARTTPRPCRNRRSSLQCQKEPDEMLSERSPSRTFLTATLQTDLRVR